MPLAALGARGCAPAITKEQAGREWVVLVAVCADSVDTNKKGHRQSSVQLLNLCFVVRRVRQWRVLVLRLPFLKALQRNRAANRCNKDLQRG